MEISDAVIFKNLVFFMVLSLLIVCISKLYKPIPQLIRNYPIQINSDKVITIDMELQVNTHTPNWIAHLLSVAPFDFFSGKKNKIN
jgi:hypothetical protein